MTRHCAVVLEAATKPVRSNGVQASRAPEPSELPRGFGVRWLVGNGADTALDGLGRTEAKAVCALTPHPPHSKTLARSTKLALVQGRTARKPIGEFSPPKEARKQRRGRCAPRRVASVHRRASAAIDAFSL